MKKTAQFIQKVQPKLTKPVLLPIQESIDLWKNSKTKLFLVTLPSGIVVEMKKLNLMECSIAGYIPFSLFTKVLNMSEQLKDTSLWEKVPDNDMTDIGTVFRKVAMLAVTSPPITEDGEDGSISVHDIPFEDLALIFTRTVKGDTSSSLVTFL